MKGLVICHKGIEDVAAKEVEELIDNVGFPEERVVVFDATEKDLVKLAYMGRSFKSVLLYLGKAKISPHFDANIKVLAQLVKEISTADWLEDKTFKVDCKRIGEHDFSSQQVCEKIGELLLKKHKCEAKMEDPQMRVYVFINHLELYIGIDFCGMNMSKRDYKLFSNSNSLNGAVAYALLRIAKIRPKMTILDPFCGSGTIAIEAALYLKNKSVNFFRKDKLLCTRFMDLSLTDFDMEKDAEFKIIAYDNQINMMKASKKNAQVAGVHKDIFISKVDIEWLDIKVDKGHIDLIATHLPVESRTMDKKSVERMYREFFYQSEYILGPKGKIALIIEKDEFLKEFLEKAKVLEKMEIAEQRTVMQGNLEMKMMILKKK